MEYWLWLIMLRTISVTQKQMEPLYFLQLKRVGPVLGIARKILKVIAGCLFRRRFEVSMLEAQGFGIEARSHSMQRASSADSTSNFKTSNLNASLAIPQLRVSIVSYIRRLHTHTFPSAALGYTAGIRRLT